MVGLHKGDGCDNEAGVARVAPIEGEERLVPALGVGGQLPDDGRIHPAERLLGCRQVARRIVVAGRDDHMDRLRQRAEAGEEVVVELHGFGRGHLAVEDVARDEEQLDVAGDNKLAQPGEEAALVFGAGDAFVGEAEVPVGGVKHSHG